MKSFFAVLILVTVFASLDKPVMAQDNQGNIFVVTNSERAFPKDGSMRELDSLTHMFQINVWDRNPLVISHKTVRHWWGSDNRDFIEITEVKSWEDIPKAMQKNNELFEQVWTSKETRDQFNKAYNKYFTGKHSDEIYSEVVAPK